MAINIHNTINFERKQLLNYRLPFGPILSTLITVLVYQIFIISKSASQTY